MRPTARKVREALFNSLGPWVEGREVLDLFAGTGALGLEALRHGAARVTLIERNPRLAQGIRETVRGQGLAGAVQVRSVEVRSALRRLVAEGRRFDLILLDPPYGRGLLQETVDDVAEQELVAPGGIVVAEGHWREAPRPPRGWTCYRQARYGETALWFLRQADGRGADAPGEDGLQ